MNYESILKPCPFCGEKAEIMECSDRFQCGCKDEDCIAWVEEMPVYLTRSGAIKEWNNRAYEENTDANYEQRYDEGYRSGFYAARDYMDEIAKESSITSIKDVFRVSSPSKAMNQKQKQAVDVFLKAMNENKEVLEIVDGEFVVKKKESGKD